MEAHNESGEENNSTPEYHEEDTAEEIEAKLWKASVDRKLWRRCSCSPADREEENTKDYQIEYKDNEESVSFLPADREEENTEDDQIEYEDNKENVSFSHADREEENTEDGQIE